MRADPNMGKKYGAKKGEVRNPTGLGKLGREALQLKELTCKEHIEVLSKLLRLTPKEMKSSVLINPYASCHEHLVANLIKRCIKRGDAFIYEKLFDRVLGKVPHTIKSDIMGPLQITIVDAEKQKQSLEGNNA